MKNLARVFAWRLSSYRDRDRRDSGDEYAFLVRLRSSEKLYRGFSKISQFLERISAEHIESKDSLEFKLKIDSICSIRIRSLNRRKT